MYAHILTLVCRSIATLLTIFACMNYKSAILPGDSIIESRSKTLQISIQLRFSTIDRNRLIALSEANCCYISATKEHSKTKTVVREIELLVTAIDMEKFNSVSSMLAVHQQIITPTRHEATIKTLSCKQELPYKYTEDTEYYVFTKKIRITGY